MLREMPSYKLTEWMAYHNIEPFGDELVDMHMAKLASILINANLKKGATPITPEKMRLWKTIEEPFDPQKYYDDLKANLNFK